MSYYVRESINQIKQRIIGYTTLVKQYLDRGFHGYLMTMMFNQLSGNERQKNHQMQVVIEGVFASLLTRITRRPWISSAANPILIGCPDWPVWKYSKITLSEVRTNDGLHYHGVLIVPVQSRLKIPVHQHFDENRDYYLRHGILRRIDVRPFIHTDATNVVDYALKGLKTGRLPDDENLLILPKTHREIAKRPYLGKLLVG